MIKPHFACLCVPLMGLLASSALAADKVTFSKKVLNAGDVMVETSERDTKNKLVIEAGPQKMPMDQSEVSNKKLEFAVTKSGAEGPTEFALKVVAYTDEEKSMMGEKKEASPLVGKTFLISKSGESISAKNEEGIAVDNDTLQEIKKVMGRGRIIDPYRKMDSFLTGQTVEVGQNVDGHKFAESVLDKGDTNLEITKAAFTLTEVKDIGGVKHGVFSVEIVAKGQPTTGVPGMSLEVGMNVKGEIVIAVDSLWVHSLKLEGTMKMDGEGEQRGQKMTMSGDGTMSMLGQAQFSKAKG